MANIHVYVYGITKLQSVYVYVYTRPEKARVCVWNVYTHANTSTYVLHYVISFVYHLQ